MQVASIHIAMAENHMPAISGKFCGISNDRLQLMTRVAQFEALIDQIVQLISNYKILQKFKLLCLTKQVVQKAL